MRKFLTTLCAMFFTIALIAQSNDPILGKWENPSGEGRIEIYKKADKFFGKLYWVKNTGKKDVNNPDEKLRNRSLQGLEILTNFSRDGKTYEEGEIYDPKSGKTYSCKMTLKGQDKLDIRGFIGFSLLGRTETWKRIE